MAHCSGCQLDLDADSTKQLISDVKTKLESYDLSLIVESAIVDQNLNRRHKDKAQLEYKHFLMMAFVSSKQRGKKWERPVPTRNADKIWHAHILHTREYMAFCKKVFGVDYIHHNPGLKEGTPEFALAVDDTKELNASMGEYVIDANYFGGNQSEPLSDCSSCST